MPFQPTLQLVAGDPNNGATDVNDTTRLLGPRKLDIDDAGNLYLWDTDNTLERILKITPEGYVSIEFTANSMAFPTSITDFCVIGQDDLWVGGQDRHIYRMVAGVSTVVIGAGGAGGYLDGPAATAKIGYDATFGLHGAFCMAVVSGELWWAEAGNHIRKLDGAGNVSTVAGNGTADSFTMGTGTAAGIGLPRTGATQDAEGNYWLFAGPQGTTIYLLKVTPGGTVSNPGSISYPIPCFTLMFGPDHLLYTFYDDWTIDRINPSTYLVLTVFQTPQGSGGVAAGSLISDTHGTFYTGYFGAAPPTGNGRTVYKFTNAATPVIPDVLPVITLHPQGTLGTVGTAITLRSTATGHPTPTVQWQKVAGDGPSTGLPTLNGVLGSWPEGTSGLIYPGQEGYPDPMGPWTDISGATSTSYTFTPSATGVTRYRAIWSNTSGQVSSNSAKVSVNASTDLDQLDPGSLVPSDDILSPGAGTPGAKTRTAAQPGSATILALVREFSAQVKRAVRITGSTEITMVDPAATNDLIDASADTLYSVVSTNRAATTKALSVLRGTITVTASAGFKTNDVSILRSGWQIPDRLPCRTLGNKRVKSVQMTFTPKAFTCDVTFHVG